MKIHITDKMYEELANALIEQLAEGDSYIQTTIRVERKHFAVELVINAIAYYKTERVELDRSCYGRQKFLHDIVPVWWEINTYWFEEDYERQVNNDGEFVKIKQYILG